MTQGLYSIICIFNPERLIASGQVGRKPTEIYNVYAETCKGAFSCDLTFLSEYRSGSQHLVGTAAAYSLVLVLECRLAKIQATCMEDLNR